MYKLEGEIHRFCERNDFSSVTYFYQDEDYFKIGRKSINSTTFEITHLPFGNSLDSTNFADVFSCINSLSLNGNYFFLAQNLDTGKSDLIQYASGSDTIVTSERKELWDSVNFEDGFYYRMPSGIVIHMNNNMTIDFEKYLGENNVIKMDWSTFLIYGKKGIYMKMFEFGCDGIYFQVVESNLCYLFDLNNCPYKYINEFQGAKTCSGQSTCPVGTYHSPLISNDAGSGPVTIDTCRNHTYLIEHCLISQVVNGKVVCDICDPSFYLLTINSEVLYCVEPSSDPRLTIPSSQLADGTGFFFSLQFIL